MKKAVVTIRGTRPYWFHALPLDAIGGKRKERTGSAGNDPEEWRKTFRADKDGQLYIPPEQIFACLRAAGRHTKAGRGTITKKVAATLQIVDKRILMDRSMPNNGSDPELNALDDLVYIDCRAVRNPATKGSNIRYRIACSEGWEAAFTILFDKTIVSEGEMHQVCLDSGILEGLGDGRSIGMGRFEVLSFEAADV